MMRRYRSANAPIKLRAKIQKSERAYPSHQMTTIIQLSHLSGNKYRTMARTIKCQFDFTSPNFQLVSPNAIDFIRKVQNSQNTRIIKTKNGLLPFICFYSELYICVENGLNCIVQAVGDQDYLKSNQISSKCNGNYYQHSLNTNTSFWFWSRRSD